MSYQAWRSVGIYIIILIVLALIAWRVYEATAANQRHDYVECWRSPDRDRPHATSGIGSAISCVNHP